VLLWSIVLLVGQLHWCQLSACAAEMDPVKIALLVDGMASRGSSYQAAELHSMGPEGLTAVLDYLLPETAQAARPPKALADDVVESLLAKLDADEFLTREAATQQLIAQARGNRPQIEQATQSDSLEVRLRAERVLASWESKPATRLSAYLSGFWAYIEGLNDPLRLQLLAERTLKALEPGMPDGDRLHLVRLCIAGVAHGRDDASCDILLPLLKHSDVKVAALVTETVGAYKTESRFVPQILVDALDSGRHPVVEAARRFVIGCEDQARKARVAAALKRLFLHGPEPLKFQACLPLMRDFQDPEAWAYVIQQAASTDASRLRTALNWIGDTKPTGAPPPTALVIHLDRLLAADSSQRRAAVLTLGKFGGHESVSRLIKALSDGDEIVGREADACLCGQQDRSLVKRLLSEAIPISGDSQLQARLRTLLARIERS
jgi:HEAT repeat protein